MPQSLNIIGSGRVGLTLGLLFRDHGIAVQDVHNRRISRSESAIAQLGTGKVAPEITDLRPADWIMITTSDDAIAPVAARLAENGDLRTGTIAFHCSGATSSEVLAPLRARGAQVASLHPLQSFTDPARDAGNFAGNFCAIDGDGPACAALEQLFTGFGGRCARIAPEHKLLYHAGAVFMSNYLMALVEAGLSAYEAAGLDRDMALSAVRPLVEGSLRNALEKGPAAALTGPIARGDTGLIARQLDALRQADPTLAALYETLGQNTVILAETRDNPSLPQETVQKMREILGDPKA